MASEPTGTAQTASPTPPKKGRKWAYVVMAALGLVLAFLGYVASLPGEFQVQRSAKIDAPADVVFPLIDNFHEWVKWSPFEKLDPNLKRTYSGPDAGKGAIYAWDGNSDAGAGSMEIQESKPHELIAIKLQFSKPFEALCPTTFKLEPVKGGTQVTWTMQGDNNFIGKLMTLFMSMDKMVGTSFEEGLAKLNTVAQANVKESKEKPIVD